MRRKVPILPDLPINERWAQSISKEPNDPKGAGLIQNYFQVMQLFLSADTETSVFWLELMKNSWFKYLYPKIYAKLILSGNIDAASTADPNVIGYHPLCPPVVHVRDFCSLIPIILLGNNLQNSPQNIARKRTQRRPRRVAENEGELLLSLGSANANLYAIHEKEERI